MASSQHNLNSPTGSVDSEDIRDLSSHSLESFQLNYTAMFDAEMKRLHALLEQRDLEVSILKFKIETDKKENEERTHALLEKIRKLELSNAQTSTNSQRKIEMLESENLKLEHKLKLAMTELKRPHPTKLFDASNNTHSSDLSFADLNGEEVAACEASSAGPRK